jgi:hypothetical protein
MTQSTDRSDAARAEKSKIVQKYKELLPTLRLNPAQFLDGLSSAEQKVPGLKPEEFVAMRLFIGSENSPSPKNVGVEKAGLEPGFAPKQRPSEKISFSQLLNARKEAGDLDSAVSRLANGDPVREKQLQTSMAMAEKTATK